MEFPEGGGARGRGLEGGVRERIYESKKKKKIPNLSICRRVISLFMHAPSRYTFKLTRIQIHNVSLPNSG